MYNITKSGYYCYTKHILKMKDHVGISKPKKHKNKIGTVHYQQNYLYITKPTQVVFITMDGWMDGWMDG